MGQGIRRLGLCVAGAPLPSSSSARIRGLEMGGSAGWAPGRPPWSWRELPPGVSGKGDRDCLPGPPRGFGGGWQGPGLASRGANTSTSPRSPARVVLEWSGCLLCRKPAHQSSPGHCYKVPWPRAPGGGKGKRIHCYYHCHRPRTNTAQQAPIPLSQARWSPSQLLFYLLPSSPEALVLALCLIHSYSSLGSQVTCHILREV